MQLLTTADVATLLNLHQRTVTNMFLAGRIPGAFRVGAGKDGKEWRVERSDFEAYIQRRRVQSLNRTPLLAA